MKDEHGVQVKITMNHRGDPPGKLADAELHWTSGPLAGNCLIGFGVWEKRERPSEISVTMPSRQFLSGGEKRTFKLFRLSNPNPAPPDDAPRDVKDAYYGPWRNVVRLIAEAYTDAASTPVEEAPAGQASSTDDIPF